MISTIQDNKEDLKDLIINNNNARRFIEEEKNNFNSKNYIKLKILLLICDCFILIENDNLEDKLNDILEMKWKHAAAVFNRFFLIISILFFLITFSSIILPLL